MAKKEESILDGYLRRGVHSLTAKEFGSFATTVSKKLNNSTPSQNYKALLNTLGKEHADKLRGVFFLGSSSAKVVHSAMSDRWLNVVLYLSPSDEALLSFWHEFGHSATWLPKKIAEQVRKAALLNPAWRAMTPMRAERLKGFHNEYDTIVGQRGIDPNYKLPDAGGMLRPLNVCPYASPNCRAVCLNSSGHGAIPDIRKADPIWEKYNKVFASRIREGYTLEDDLQYLYLKGIQAKYGGSVSSAAAQRRMRTHAMWLIWAKQGCIQNDFIDMLFYEALRYKEMCDKAGVPMALRLNGTSDIPVHTLKLNKAKIGTRSLAGKNLVQELGRLGIVCYDYTKDYQRVKQWIQARSWKDSDTVVKLKKPIVRAGFPSNYYLCYSWSEVNGELALRVLRGGANVVMVFRRSLETGRKEIHKLPKTARSAGSLPTAIEVAQLSRNPEYKGWRATVIDGDRTDLRFDDESHIGEKNKGLVVGLIAKGKAGFGKQRYNDTDRKTLWRVFAHAITLEEKEGKIYAILRKNPGADGRPGAVDAIDVDLLDQATAIVDGWAITTTAMAT